jgi:hypothetical protein
MIRIAITTAAHEAIAISSTISCLPAQRENAILCRP